METKWRREYKHLIHAGEKVVLEQRLSRLMQRDHNYPDAPHYHIRSLYLENDANKILNEKKAGIAIRDKYRIRYYNFDPSYIRLERKSKRCAYGCKTGCVITQAQCLQLICGDIGWMQETENEFLREVYLACTLYRLRPTVIVDYLREAFVYPVGNVRVTIDSQVRSGNDINGFFSKSLPNVPVNPPEVSVLEVKYDEFLPDFISQAIQIGSRKDQAFSKYTACRIFG